MSQLVLDKIEYLILLVAGFATHSKVSEAQAYSYLNSYDIMHTLPLEENIHTLQSFCQRKGGHL